MRTIAPSRLVFRRAARVVALSAAALLARPATAQTFDWVQPHTVTYAHNPDMVRTAAAPLSGGGGWWVSTEDNFQFYGSEVLGTMRLSRLRSNGTVGFQRVVEGNASILQVQAVGDGGAVLLGEYLDSLVFSPQHRYVNPHANSGLVYFLACIDSVGAVRWARTLRSLNSHAAGIVQGANALILDPHGSSVWAGYDTFGDSYATRFDLTTGDSISSIVQEHVGRITSIALAPNGTTYVAGSCASDGGIYNGTAVRMPAGITYNSYVACYSASGAYQWVHHLDDVTCPVTWVSTADDQGVYFAGPLHGPWHFGPFQASGGGAANPAYFLTRLDRQTGNFLWLRESPGTSFTGHTQAAFHQPLAADAAGNAWLLTNTTGTTTWPGFGTLTTPIGGTSALLAYSSQGTLLAVKLGGGRLSTPHTLALDPISGQGVIAGIAHEGGLQLGALPPMPLVGVNQLQLFVAGFRPTLTPLGTAGFAAAPDATLYPNPVTAGSHIRLTATSDLAEAIITDAVGRRVARHTLSGAMTEIAAPATAGLYLLRVRDVANHTTTRRLVVQ